MFPYDHKSLTVDPLQGDGITMFFRFLIPNVLLTKRKDRKFIHRFDDGSMQLEGEGDRNVAGYGNPWKFGFFYYFSL